MEKEPKTAPQADEIEDKSRREAIAAMAKYTAAIGGAATVVLSAQEAVAWSAASGDPHSHKRPKRKFKRRLRKKVRWWFRHR
ncbi:MAG: hypothetical protein AAFY84_15960 [Pseudomonadota bacterium]